MHSIRKNTDFRVLWADALCINQSDNEEKSWQVQQMAAIYSRARATISWLGLPSGDSKLALESLAELDKKTRGWHWSIQEAMEGGTPPRKVKNGIEQITSDLSSWSAIVNLCSRPYWSRMWICQEMACARDRYFLCGDNIVKELDRPIAFLLAWQATHENPRRNSIGPQCLTMVDSVQSFRFHGNSPADAPYYIRPGTLHDILLRLKSLDSGEIRDKIYAPLSVATDRDELGLVPDYSKDLGLIFKETACALLRAGYIGVLLSAGSQDKLLRLPSWVPDWSAPFEGGFDRRQYRADNKISQRSSTLKALPPHSDHVILDGYVVGSITWIHDKCPAASLRSLEVQSGISPTFADWLSQFESAIFFHRKQKGSDRKPKNRYNTPESATAELLCTVGGQRPVWSLSANPYLTVYSALKSAKSLESLLLNLASGNSRSENLQLVDCIRKIQQTLETGSRPYLTDSGAMGLTWNDKDAMGDVVVVIPGACVPCVVRPLDRAGTVLASSPSSTTSQPGRHYELVNVTYVHGIMNGEFFKQKKDERQVQSFSLY